MKEDKGTEDEDKKNKSKVQHEIETSKGLAVTRAYIVPPGSLYILPEAVDELTNEPNTTHIIHLLLPVG